MLKKFLFFISIVILVSNCKSQSIKNKITVSILPQKYFVERISGNIFQVNVMIPPGQEPHSYEPLPRQIKDLSLSKAYFAIGVPFEDSWLPKIKRTYPDLKIIHTEKGITFKKLEKNESHQNHNDEEKDPHIWLSPELVKIQAKNIYDAMILIDPENKKIYKENYISFISDLENISKELKLKFSTLEKKEFIVFHPSWGYFADEFGLTQIPIEIDGKEPSPKQILNIINFAKKKDIKVIFVQEQFSKDSADTIASEINGRVISIDPLSYDYLNNLKNIADKITSVKEEL